MGLNAQTSVPTFTANQVLTAQQQNWINTGIPVFATTTTRDAAFGGAGEKTLAQGQYAYIEATSSLMVYSGSAWITVGAGMACVKAETAFSAVASFSADNVFTSNYTNYKIICRLTGTTGGTVSLQLRTGGVAATTNYNFQRLSVSGGGTTATRTTASASFTVGAGSTGSFMESFFMELTGPQLAEATTINNLFTASDTSYAFPDFFQIVGNHSTATSYDGFAITAATGTITGSYTVYGYSKVAS